MTPGPILIMKAPGCTRPVKLLTHGSGNTFGATLWTDGKLESPMLPADPWLLKSPSEGVMFWSDECEEIERIYYFSGNAGNSEWKDLEYAKEPTENDYFEALQSGLASTPERERYIRIRLWWCFNDRVREGNQVTLSDAHRDNLERLAEILSNEVDDQRLMKAEVLRNLSKFDEALLVLDSEFPEEYAFVVQKIRDLALQSNSQVAKLE